MGFNNVGLEEVIKNLKNNKTVLIGGNIGKNKITPNSLAIDDYIASFNLLFNYVDYFVVNVSSPNTPNLRDLQEKEPLTKLINSLLLINRAKESPKPVLLKIAPDLNDNQLMDIISIVKDTGLDGIIATNTTINRENLKSDNKNETGGLSGKPLTSSSICIRCNVVLFSFSTMAFFHFTYPSAIKVLPHSNTFKTSVLIIGLTLCSCTHCCNAVLGKPIVTTSCAIFLIHFLLGL